MTRFISWQESTKKVWRLSGWLNRILGATIFFFLICTNQALAEEKVNEGHPSWAKPFPAYVFNISEVMLYDVINPPAAARYYAYTSLAAYCAHENSPELVNYFQQPMNLGQVERSQEVDTYFAAAYALLETGKKLIPSGYRLEEKQKSLIEDFRKKGKASKRKIESSIRYATEIADKVIAYSSSDGYRKLSTLTRYSPTGLEGKWYPTPPAYIEAIEPHWNTIRPFYMDSASQFAPPPPAPFSKEAGSAFHEQMMRVYTAVKNRTKEETEIAKFWDCNPFEVEFSGHMAIGIKKITPGGHWMGIAGIAATQAGWSADSTIYTFAFLATTMHDAFISCWDEKYRSDRIRPETIINRLVDPQWRPILQTPPFPEYTSGHSVVSAASASMLTALFGEPFHFNDTTEIFFGLPAREFSSFRQASEEAAISRLYGGIHYPDACEQGVIQGKNIAAYILNRTNRKKPEMAEPNDNIMNR